MPRSYEHVLLKAYVLDHGLTSSLTLYGGTRRRWRLEDNFLINEWKNSYLHADLQTRPNKKEGYWWLDYNGKLSKGSSFSYTCAKHWYLAFFLATD